MNTHLTITTLPGVGQKRAELLAKLGIETIGDLLYHFPRAYQNRGNVTSLDSCENGATVSVVLTVATAATTAKLPGMLTLTKFVAFDDTGKCTVTFFNQAYLQTAFQVGSTYRFYGKITRRKASLELSSPAWEAAPEDVILPDFTPVYPLTTGISSKMLDGMIRALLPQIDGIVDPIPESVRVQHSLIPLAQALRDIHSPTDYAALDAARRRLIFEEFYLFCMQAQKNAAENATAPTEFARVAPTSLAPVLEQVSFTLTDAQTAAVEDIVTDMTGDTAPMERLLSGDVGSGKTICAACAIYLAAESGYQAAIMTPTEILATQHFHDLAPPFEALGFSCALLVGSLTAKKKQAVRAALADGSVDIVFGTVALITDDTDFANLGLVVTDEQHRFGVNQRDALAAKSNGAHSLTMSATPIPRTMAHILYNGISISHIDTMPPGRQRVDTFVVNESYRARLNAFIEKQIVAGNQVYIVCPAVDNSEDEDNLVGLDYREGEEQVPLKSAVVVARELQETFANRRVAHMHGRLKGEEKERIMRKFAAGEIDILVSTTVIEVGVNVPNTTLMIVENAERFGLAQLHQLRGRVGRGSAKSYCILVTESAENSASYERLRTLAECYNGYEIAERDLAQRGPGDFFAQPDVTRQHGSLKFRLASLCDSFDLLKDAAAAAKTQTTADLF